MLPNRIAFMIESGGEIQDVLASAVATVTKGDVPETIVDQRHAIGAVDRSQEITGAGIEGVDDLVAEVSNQTAAD
jgi:hypothetical protein